MGKTTTRRKQTRASHDKEYAETGSHLNTPDFSLKEGSRRIEEEELAQDGGGEGTGGMMRRERIFRSEAEDRVAALKRARYDAMKKREYISTFQMTDRTKPHVGEVTMIKDHYVVNTGRGPLERVRAKGLQPRSVLDVTGLNAKQRRVIARARDMGRAVPDSALVRTHVNDCPAPERVTINNGPNGKRILAIFPPSSRYYTNLPRPSRKTRNHSFTAYEWDVSEFGGNVLRSSLGLKDIDYGDKNSMLGYSDWVKLDERDPYENKLLRDLRHADTLDRMVDNMEFYRQAGWFDAMMKFMDPHMAQRYVDEKNYDRRLQMIKDVGLVDGSQVGMADVLTTFGEMEGRDFIKKNLRKDKDIRGYMLAVPNLGLDWGEEVDLAESEGALPDYDMSKKGQVKMGWATNGFKIVVGGRTNPSRLMNNFMSKRPNQLDIRVDKREGRQKTRLWFDYTKEMENSLSRHAKQYTWSSFGEK